MDWISYYRKRSFLRCFAAILLYHWPLLLEILKCRPRRVMEMGVGKGPTTMLLSWLVPESIGVDNDSQIVMNAIAFSRLLFPRSNWWMADMFTMWDVLTDVCYSQGTLEHFSDEQIREAVRVQLKLAPVVLISVPSFYYPRKDFGDERLMPIAHWLYILSDFKIEKYYYYGWHNDILIKVVR